MNKVECEIEKLIDLQNNWVLDFVIDLTKKN